MGAEFLECIHPLAPSPPYMPVSNTQHSIRAVSPKDSTRIERLWAARFGSADFMSINDENLIEYASSPHTNCDMYVATTPTNDIIGFVVGFILPPHALREWIGHTPQPLPTSALNGFIQAIAVHPTREHEGIASALLHRMLKHFKTVGAKHAHAVSWRRDNTVDSSGLFTKFTFEELAHIENFYSRGDIPRQNCPDCPSDPCNCAGTVYTKPI